MTAQIMNTLLMIREKIEIVESTREDIATDDSATLDGTSEQADVSDSDTTEQDQ